jgi:hypothetical protein
MKNKSVVQFPAPLSEKASSLDFLLRLPSHTDVAKSQESDIVLLLSDPDIFKRYYVGRFNATHYTSTQIPACANCLSSPIQYIGTQCQTGDGRYGSFHTVSNLGCHLGLQRIDVWPSTRALREVGRRLTAQLPTLKQYEEEILKQVQNNLIFTLPNGKRKTVNLTHEVDDLLATMSGSFGISKGVLCGVANMETLSRQPRGYISPENRAEILRTLTAFRGWLKLKAAMIDRCLEVVREEDEEETEAEAAERQ